MEEIILHKKLLQVRMTDLQQFNVRDSILGIPLFLYQCLVYADRSESRYSVGVTPVMRRNQRLK